jgi:hypothetical protein
MTVFAGFMPADYYFRFRAEDSFLKLDRDVFPQVGTSLHAAASPATTAECVSEAEELAKNLSEVLEHRGIETHASRSSATDSSVTVAIIKRALVRVGKNPVGLSDFFKTFLRIRVVRVAVRMVLHRELAICTLQFNLSHSAADAKHLVIVAFCVRGQN